MKRRRIFLLAAVVMVLALVVIVWPRGPKEPVYQGKTLTRWLEEYLLTPIPTDRVKARDAVQAIGTNALPFLLHEYTRPMSTWRNRLNSLAKKLPGLKIHLRTDGERMNGASWGLRILGSNAAPAIPVLLQYLHGHERRLDGIGIIFGMDDAALPHLSAALASTNSLTVSNALRALEPFAFRGRPGRDVLAVALQHPDPNIRVAALQSWCNSLASSAEQVPALLKLANDPSPLVVQEVRNQLARWGVPALPPVSNAASNALLTLQTNAPPPRTP